MIKKLIILALMALPWPVLALPELKPDFPKLANYFLHWTVSEQEAKDLAKFDLVILDADAQERSRANLELMRKLNPDIVLLAYVPASEIRRDVKILNQIAPLRFRLGSAVPDEAYLKDSNNERRSFWPGTWIVDITDYAPNNINGARWNEYLPQFVTDQILSANLWDGVFYDNAWDDIVHFAKGPVDIDRDGIADNDNEAREIWKQGLRKIYDNTIKLNPDKFVFANDGPIYAPYVHGVLLENFPRKGWGKHASDIKYITSSAKYPSVVILNSNTLNTGNSNNWSLVRFGLASAFLYDAYFSFDFGDQDHGQTWMYDEYGVFLGEAIGSAYSRGNLVWQRDFEQGIAFVNAGDAPKTINLPLEVEKIKGVQDPKINDGLITQSLVINPKDGLVVLRPIEKIYNAFYENGVFARVFDASGRSVRAGFFSYDKTQPAGSIIGVFDLDGDDKPDKVMVSKGVIDISFGDGESSRIVPFGGKDMNIDVGDLNNDGMLEIVAVQGGQVRVYRSNGSLLSIPFSPFGSKYKGGVNVSVGDLNGDGFFEIIMGAGAGGGPQVRVFDGNGRLLSGGFFAYDPRFRGGVNVAVGDADGDGNAEIVTGAGDGGGPQVRIFDGKGIPISPGFFAYERSSRSGVVPIMTDVNNDGVEEILAVTKNML